LAAQEEHISTQGCWVGENRINAAACHSGSPLSQGFGHGLAWRSLAQEAADNEYG
jgi:hypothetical protein